MTPSSAPWLFVALVIAVEAAEQETRHHRHHRHHHRHWALRRNSARASAPAAAPAAAPEAVFLGSKSKRKSHQPTSQRAARADVAESDLGNQTQSPPMTLKQTDVRPSSEGEPTVVNFGLFVKQFYGVDFKLGTVTADIVLTLRWIDNRTASLVPKGLSDITFSQDRAAALMWMPDVAVTNSDIEGTQVTSTGVTVSSDGAVQKVQRLLTIVKNTFDIRAFPFDAQSLKFRVASTTLMASDLQLAALSDEGLSGVKSGTFVGKEFDFVSSNAHVFDDKDGLLEKSRGELVIMVQRCSEPYVKNLLVPSLILVAIAYTVFLFPLKHPFIMPRVTTSLVSFMALMVLSLRTSDMMPIRGDTSWMDVFEESCQILMIITLCMNILTEVIEHELKQHQTAKRMQLELRCALPLVKVVVFCIIFTRTDGTGLWWLSVITKALIFIILLPYLCWCGKRVMDCQAADKAEASK